MNYVLSTKQMREAETRVIEKLGISSELLMETAGKACADYLLSQGLVSSLHPVLILCGTGNNGGDGAVIARWLDHYGIPAFLALVGEGELSPETAKNISIYDKLGPPSIQIGDLDDLEEFRQINLSYGLIIDAVFGTGFHGKLSKFYRELFQTINSEPAIKVSIDIPSGINGDTGYGQGHIQSDLTLVIGAYKYGNLLGEGKAGPRDHHLIDIGIPESYLQDLNPAWLVDEETVVFPERYTYAHKGTYGEVMILAGSPGMAGAAILAAKAALRSGAGYVRLYAHPQLVDSYIGANPEILIETVPLSSDGKVDANALHNRVHDPSVILIGPGIGTGLYGSSLLEFALTLKDIPLVLDADALNILASKPELMLLTKGKDVLLTPHLGEFSRLAKVPIDELRLAPLKTLQEYIRKFKLPVLLKSNTSVFADQFQTIFNISGNDGLATGGSGDVLAGIIASFITQGSTIHNAATGAAYLLGHTADILAKNWQTAAITPLLIIDHLFEIGDEE